MPITTVLFDLDGTLLPMDQEVFVRTYLGLLAKKMAALGYGHGVGLSPYGAQYLAQHGPHYRTTLAPHYLGTPLRAVG